MPALEISSVLLPAISFAMNHYPDGTPARYQKITSFMTSYCTHYPAHYNDRCRSKVSGQGKVKLIDVKSRQDIKILCETLIETSSVWLGKSSFRDVFDITNGVMPVVLVPETCVCHRCEGELKTDSRPSIVTVYTNTGKEIGHSYHKKCAECGILAYYSYFKHVNGRRTFYTNVSSKPYFMISGKTVFSDAMVKLCAVQIEISFVSFESVCNQYFALTGDLLDKQRVEEAYFLYRLIDIYNTFDEVVDVTTDDDTCRKDIEELCKNVIEDMVTLTNLAEDHQCEIPGCKEGFIVADGVEKIHRRVCAAPRSTYRLSKDMTRTVSMCPETPILGNQHTKPSKYCSDHSYLEDDDQPPTKKPHIIVTINVADKKVSTRVANLSEGLPDNEDESVHIGCKKPENVPRFHNRTAGLMTLVKPCGIIVSVSELLSCESPSQLFVQLLQLHCDTRTKFDYLGYDRACEFQPFLKNLHKKSNNGAGLLLQKTYVVDRFHIQGHKTPACDINSPLCQFHPDLEANKDLKGVNTGCAEQCFSWLTRFKYSVKYMTQYKFKFFVYLIVMARNKFITCKLQKDGKM